MKLYTRNGDKGTTSLYNGEKVGKSSDKIRLLAEIDHFISLYGSNFSDDIEILIALMDICTIVANPSKCYEFDFENDLVNMIESETDSIMKKLPKLTKFILSDNYIHVIRTECRKLETKLVELNNDSINRFINRLSSLLFARAYAKSKGKFYTSKYIYVKEMKKIEDENKICITLNDKELSALFDDNKNKTTLIFSSVFMLSFLFLIYCFAVNTMDIN